MFVFQDCWGFRQVSWACLGLQVMMFLVQNIKNCSLKLTCKNNERNSKYFVGRINHFSAIYSKQREPEKNNNGITQ